MAAEVTEARRMADDRRINGRKNARVEQNAPGFAEHGAQQLREIVERLDLPVGKEQLRPEHPDREVEQDHRKHPEQEIVSLHLEVLRAAPALRLEEVRVGQVHQRTTHRADHRDRDEQRVEVAGLRRHLEPDESLHHIGRIEANPERRADEGHGKDPEEEQEDDLEPLVHRLEHEEEADDVAEEPPLPDLAEAKDIPAHLADADRHVRAIDVAHQDGGSEQRRRIPAVQPREAVEHALAVLVAELVARDQRDENVTKEERAHQHPHQRVTVVRTGHAHVDHVAGTEPGQDDDNAGAEGLEVFEESGRDAGVRNTRHRRGRGGSLAGGFGHMRRDGAGKVPPHKPGDFARDAPVRGWSPIPRLGRR